jgi:hypothetical protein
MVRLGTDGRIISVMGPYHDQAAQTESGSRYLFGPWAKEAAGDSTIWYGPGDRFEMREIAMDGTVLRLVRLDRPRQPITADFVQEYIDGQIERARAERPEVAQFIAQMYADAAYPSAFPAHYEMKTDDAGNLWVQEYGLTQDDRPLDWSVFDRAGRFLGEVEMPAGFGVHQIGDDFVLGRWTDELEVEYILMYGIVKPGG